MATVYASAAFVIIELVNNLTEPLSLPVSLSTIVVIVLAVGFPLAMVISWLYDLTAKGIEKTKPLSEIEEEKPAIPNAWKIATYVSFVVIIGLVVMNIMGRSNQFRPGEIQSILILPFQNYTGDDQLDPLISGMHYALISDVGRVIKVISKHTSDGYLNSEKTLSQIASELNVDAVIEPAVMCLGDTACFYLTMNTPQEEQIWNVEYRESKSQLSNLNNQLTKQIADQLKIELTADEDQILSEYRTIDPDASEAYNLGLYYLYNIDRNSLPKAQEYFNKAIEMEPDWAPPYTGLVSVWSYQKQMSFVEPAIAIPKMYENLNRALELDPNSSDAHRHKAGLAVWTELNWEKGEEEYHKALQLNPSDALSRILYAHLLGILNRNDEAIYQANLALELDPQGAFILGLYAAVMLHMGNYQSAIEHAEKALSINPNHRFAIIVLGGAYRKIGDYEKWFEYLKRLDRYNDYAHESIDSVFEEQGYSAAVEITINSDVAKASEGYVDFVLQGSRYLELNNYEKAMDCYEKAYEMHNSNLPYIATKYYGYPLKNNPRYLALMKKLNLPLPHD